MLYVTTRSSRDAYTPFRALWEGRGPDGGYYVPGQLPVIAPEEILRLGEKPFGQCVTEIFNLFFGTHLNAWDMDFSVGKHPIRLRSLNHRIIIGETWHNLSHSFSGMVQKISSAAMEPEDRESVPGAWAWITLRIGVFFGLYGELLRQGSIATGQALDVALPCGDFSIPISAWYAKAMGLPIGNIICGSRENSALWQLMHQGELETKEEDLPAYLEQLIFSGLGSGEACRYLEICRKGGTYVLKAADLQQMRSGLFAAVVGEDRVASVIRGVSRTQNYVLTPELALSYAGLRDFRARTSEIRVTLMLMERSQQEDIEAIAEVLKLSPSALKEQFPSIK